MGSQARRPKDEQHTLSSSGYDAVYGTSSISVFFCFTLGGLEDTTLAPTRSSCEQHLVLVTKL